MTRLPPLHPAVAATRSAVRPLLAEAARGGVLVALSGGADSLALAAAVAFEAPKLQCPAGAIVIDHGLQPGSAEVADRAARTAGAFGLAPVAVHRVDVESAHPDGPEAAARAARYEALETLRVRFEAELILTAHTRDDQAEQVLLALARGSGTRAISGIPPRRGRIARPFLDVSRETTLAACAAQGLAPWDDPQNHDPRFTRVRVRERLIPELIAELGESIPANLARSASLAREDADALDTIAQTLTMRLARLGDCPDGGGPGCTRLPVTELAAQPHAIRNRILRRVATAVFGQQQTREHTLSIAALVHDWRGQGPIHAPGGNVSRVNGELHFHSN